MSAVVSGSNVALPLISPLKDGGIVVAMWQDVRNALDNTRYVCRKGAKSDKEQCQRAMSTTTAAAAENPEPCKEGGNDRES